jgi:competence protein ComEC
MQWCVMLKKVCLCLVLVCFIWLVYEHWLEVFSPENSVLFTPHATTKISGWVDSLPYCKKTRCRFDFLLSRVEGKVVRGKIRVYWYGHHPYLAAGQYMQFRFKTFVSHSYRIKKILWGHQLLARGDVVSTLPVYFDIKRNHARSVLVLRQAIENMIKRSIHNSSLRASIAALTIGARNLLSKSDWKVYQYSGTSHLVAVSGLHFGIVYLLFYAIIFRLCCVLGFQFKAVAMPLFAQYMALIVSCFYAELVGFSLPAERAWLMLLMAVMPGLFALAIPLWRRILYAMLIIIMVSPGAVTEASFWLSFSAVSFLAYVLRCRIGYTGRINEWLKLNLAVTIGLLPLTLGYFYRVSGLAVVANFFAVPWVTLLVVPCCLLAVLVSFFSPLLAQTLFHLTADIFYPLWCVLGYFSHIRAAVYYVHKLSRLRFCLGVVGVCVFLSPLPITVRFIGLLYCLVFAHNW